MRDDRYYEVEERLAQQWDKGIPEHECIDCPSTAACHHGDKYLEGKCPVFEQRVEEEFNDIVEGLQL